MTTLYQVRTFDDIVETIREEMQIGSSDTNRINRIKRDVNFVLEEVANEKSWWWLQGYVTLQMPAYISSGTVSLTGGSASVTFSIAPGPSVAGYWFATDGYQEIYRIESHTAGATTAKLDSLYGGATDTDANFKLWKDRIPLPVDCKETIGVYHDHHSVTLEAKPLVEYRRIVALSPRSEGQPRFYYTGDFVDPSQTSSISSLPAVSSRSSAGNVKTLVFASGLPSALLSRINAGDPVRIHVSGAGTPSYNCDALISSVATTSIANDTITYSGKGELQESSTSDSSISITQLDQEVSYDRYRELFLYPCLSTSRIALHVDYVKRILPLQEDSDEPPMPVGDRMVLVYGALHRAWSRDRNPEEAARNYQLYQSKLAKMAGKLQDSQENPKLQPNKQYLAGKRGIAKNRRLDYFSPIAGSGGTSAAVITGTPSTVAVFDSNGNIGGSTTVSTTELGYLDGVSSNIQTQLDAKALDSDLDAHIADTSDAHAGSAITNTPSGNLAATTVQAALDELQTDVDTRLTASSTATLTNKTFDADGSGNSITNIENADIKAAAAIALNKLAATTASRTLVSDGSGFVSASGVTATTLGYLDATSSVQTQLDAKIPKTLTTTTGDMIYASSNNTPARLAIGSSGQVIKSVGGIPTWSTFSGGINYLSSNPDAEADTTGWTVSKNTSAAATPDSGFVTSGTNITWTRNTSSPQRGSADFKLTKDAANRQGEQVSYAFTLDAADKAKPICVSCDITVTSGTYADGDLIFYLYDGTDFIQPAPYRILSATAGLSQKWIGYFQTSASATSYKLIVHVSSASSSAYAVQFDNFNVGPTYQSYGAVATDWQSFTSTSGLTGGTTTAPGYWRRVGDTMEVYIDYLGTTIFTAGSATFTIPTGYTIDTAKIPGTAVAATTPIFGQAQFYDVGTAVYNGTVVYNTTTSVYVRILRDDQGTGSGYIDSDGVSTTQPFTWVNSDRLALSFRVPIVGWSSNVQVSSDADTRVNLVSLTGSSTSITSSGVAIVPTTVDKNTHGAFSTSTFTVPSPGDYQVFATMQGPSAAYTAGDTVSVQIKKNGGTPSLIGVTKAQRTATDSYTASGAITIPNCVAGDTLIIYGYSTVTGTIANYYASFQRISGPAQIAASESVSARYQNTAGTTFSTQADFPFATKIYDSHNAFSGSTFTAPMAGKYRFTVQMQTQAVSLSTSQLIAVYLIVTSTPEGLSATQQTLDFRWGEGVSHVRMASGSATISLNQGDIVKVQHEASASTSLSTSTRTNIVQIERVGN